jgi:hypothetical protein
MGGIEGVRNFTMSDDLIMSDNLIRLVVKIGHNTRPSTAFLLSTN